MVSESNNLLSSLVDSVYSPEIKVFIELNHLKRIYRKGWLQRKIPITHCESVAEHTFGVAILALLLAETYFPELDKFTLVKYALIHDIGEIYVGDITPEDQVPKDEKLEAERKAIRNVFEKYPGGEKYIRLWEEYEAAATPEAIFVKQIDRLEMSLQAGIYQSQDYEDMNEFLVSADNYLTEPVLREFLDQIYLSLFWFEE